MFTTEEQRAVTEYRLDSQGVSGPGPKTGAAVEAELKKPFGLFITAVYGAVGAVYEAVQFTKQLVMTVRERRLAEELAERYERGALPYTDVMTVSRAMQNQSESKDHGRFIQDSLIAEATSIFTNLASAVDSYHTSLRNAFSATEAALSADRDHMVSALAAVPTLAPALPALARTFANQPSLARRMDIVLDSANQFGNDTASVPGINYLPAPTPNLKPKAMVAPEFFTKSIDMANIGHRIKLVGVLSAQLGMSRREATFYANALDGDVDGEKYPEAKRFGEVFRSLKGVSLAKCLEHTLPDTQKQTSVLTQFLEQYKQLSPRLGRLRDAVDKLKERAEALGYAKNLAASESHYDNMSPDAEPAPAPTLTTVSSI